MEQKTVNLFEGYQKRAGWKKRLHNCKRRSIMGPPPGDRLSADIVEALKRQAATQASL
jgi:hypothetical protein